MRTTARLDDAARRAAPAGATIAVRGASLAARIADAGGRRDA